MTAADLYTSPEYAALLAGVRANPADDLPRLILADWLEEQGGGAAAAFVRQQCGNDRDESRWQGTFVGTPFDGSFPRLPPLSGLGAWYTFRRGLLDEVVCEAAEWLRHGPAVVRHPLACVRRVLLPERAPGRPAHRNPLSFWWVRQPPGVPLHRSGPMAPREFWHDTGYGRRHRIVRVSPGYSPGLFAGEMPPFPLLTSGGRYDTEADALDALSEAALAYAWSHEPASTLAAASVH